MVTFLDNVELITSGKKQKIRKHEKLNKWSLRISHLFHNAKLGYHFGRLLLI